MSWIEKPRHGWKGYRYGGCRTGFTDKVFSFEHELNHLRSPGKKFRKPHPKCIILSLHPYLSLSYIARDVVTGASSGL